LVAGGEARSCYGAQQRLQEPSDQEIIEEGDDKEVGYKYGETDIAKLTPLALDGTNLLLD
jgi:hypothetical protein